MPRPAITDEASESMTFRPVCDGPWQGFGRARVTANSPTLECRIEGGWVWIFMNDLYERKEFSWPPTDATHVNLLRKTQAA